MTTAAWPVTTRTMDTGVREAMSHRLSRAVGRMSGASHIVVQPWTTDGSPLAIPGHLNPTSPEPFGRRFGETRPQRPQWSTRYSLANLRSGAVSTDLTGSTLHANYHITSLHVGRRVCCPDQSRRAASQRDRGSSGNPAVKPDTTTGAARFCRTGRFDPGEPGVRSSLWPAGVE